MFLIGLSLPLYVVHSVNQPLSIWDLVAIVVCVSGIVIAYFADTQLYDFVTKNDNLKGLGKPAIPVLDYGLWHYSRHPNYLGEQLWWWGLVIFAWNLGQGWTLIGALVNTMCLAYVTKLVEERMVKQGNRAEAFRLYQKTTSVWIPWFKSSPLGVKDKNSWSFSLLFVLQFSLLVIIVQAKHYLGIFWVFCLIFFFWSFIWSEKVMSCIVSSYLDNCDSV